MAVTFTSNYLFPNEGLNYLLNIVPRNTAPIPTTTYMGLFTTPWLTIQSGTSNVTLSGTTFVGGTPTFIAEANFTNYSRSAIPNTAWGAGTGASLTISGSGGFTTGVSGQATVTATGYTFTANSSQTIWGIFISNSGGTTGSAGTGASGTVTVLWYAPFSDLNSVTLASGDSLTVTPTWQFASNAG